MKKVISKIGSERNKETFQNIKDKINKRSVVCVAIKGDNKAFTLLEMLMVIFIIALLLLLTIPNITKHKDSVETTTCQAYADMAQTQATAYAIAEGEEPSSIEDLVSAGYIPSATCDDGTPLTLTGRGEVTVDIKDEQ